MVDNSKKRKKILIYTTISFFIIAILVFFYWFLILRFEEYTDDAYVNGNLVALTPQVPGIVSSIYVDNTDFTVENQVLIDLDKTDYQLAFEESKSELAETVRNVVQMFLKVKELEATLDIRKTEALRARQDYENRVHLVPIGGVSKEEFEHKEAALRSADSGVKETERQLESAIALVQNTTVRTHPLVVKSKEKVSIASVNLQRATIVSPVTGYIAMRSAQLGQWVSLTEPLLSIVPLNELWVDANFKETQLAKMRVGQPVHVTADIYGRKVNFHGKVIGINPGTGNVFSALPPQNATGNWIKIVQRVPVRISLDPKILKKHPLWLGLSMKITVDISNTDGEMLSIKENKKPIYQTTVYQKQKNGADEIIETIIKDNIGSYDW